MKDFRAIIYELKELGNKGLVEEIYNKLASNSYEPNNLTEEVVPSCSKAARVSISMVPEKYAQGVQINLGEEEYRLVSDTYNTHELVRMLQDLLKDGGDVEDISNFLKGHTVIYNTGELNDKSEDTQTANVQDGLKIDTKMNKSPNYEVGGIFELNGKKYTIDSIDKGKMFLIDSKGEVFTLDEAENQVQFLGKPEGEFQVVLSEAKTFKVMDNSNRVIKRFNKSKLNEALDYAFTVSEDVEKIWQSVPKSLYDMRVADIEKAGYVVESLGELNSNEYALVIRKSV